MIPEIPELKDCGYDMWKWWQNVKAICGITDEQEEEKYTDYIG